MQKDQYYYSEMCQDIKDLVKELVESFGLFNFAGVRTGRTMHYYSIVR